MGGGSRRAAIVAALLSSACSSTFITAPHQPYAALLDHAGQVDVAVRGGGITTNQMTGAVQAAYAPVDNLEIAASVDADLVNDDSTRTLHLGGGAAIGTFTRTDVLRIEALVGGNGGYSEGAGNRCSADSMSTCARNELFRLTGPYGQAFIQGTIGFEIPYFEFAGGLRFFTHSVLVHAAGDMGTDSTDWFTRGFVEPFLVVRVPIDWFRIELVTGLPIAFAGNSGAIAGTSEPGAYYYLTLGLGIQLDTMTSPIVGRDQYIAPAVD